MTSVSKQGISELMKNKSKGEDHIFEDVAQVCFLFHISLIGTFSDVIRVHLFLSS